MYTLVVFFLIVLIWYVIYYNFYIYDSYYFMENYENGEHNYDIDYYAITMKREVRIQNIFNQTNIINKDVPDKNKITIEQVDAVVGLQLNLKELVDNNVLSPDFYAETKHRKTQVGCSLSHLKTYDIIKNKNKSGYSVVFEDDFDIVTPDFINIVNSSLKIAENEGFDILLLGNNADVVKTSENENYPKNKGENIKDNVYHFNPNIIFFGTYAILINNKNIQHVIDNLKYITQPIDDYIYKVARENKIKVLTLYPCIVEHLHGIPSTVLSGNNSEDV